MSLPRARASQFRARSPATARPCEVDYCSNSTDRSSNMNKRKPGNRNLEISAIGLSCIMKITRIGSQRSVKGPADWFTGSVHIDPLFQPNNPARTSGACVTFEPGARTVVSQRLELRQPRKTATTRASAVHFVTKASRASVSSGPNRSTFLRRSATDFASLTCSRGCARRVRRLSSASGYRGAAILAASSWRPTAQVDT